MIFQDTLGMHTDSGRLPFQICAQDVDKLSLYVSIQRVFRSLQVLAASPVR